MRIVIDRFEGEFAVALGDDRAKYNLPKTLFKDAKEGDVYIIKRDEGETEKRKEQAKGLMDELFE